MSTVLDGLRSARDGDLKEAVGLNLTVPFDNMVCPRQAEANLIPPWQKCRCWSHENGAQVFCCLRHQS